MFLNYTLIFYFILPILDFWIYKRHLRKQIDGVPHKVAYYLQSLIELWLPTTIVLVFCLLGLVSPKEIGLAPFDLGVNCFPYWFCMGVVIVAVLIILYLLIDIIRMKTNPSHLEALNKRVNSMKMPEYLKYIHPDSKKEKRLYTALSLSAGITEEILYRGFLIYILFSILPQLNHIIILLVSSLLFGAGHVYQGVSGIIKTSILGFVFGLIYLSTGTILPIMLLHILIDLSSSFLEYRNTSEQNFHSAS